MATMLLSTKLHIPSPRPNLVRRTRLVQQLEEGRCLGHRLTLVSAPAGFGKTTLVGEWLEPEHRVAWLALDEGDNDPLLFLNYLIAALQQVDARAGTTVRQLLQSPQFPPAQVLVTSLINDLTAATADLTLVLDDYHLISSPAVHEIVQFLLDYQPPCLHLVIITREDPPLALPRLRARGQVTELRERDLRFDAEEAAAFLNWTMGLNLSPQSVAELEARTEGWVVGLQLAALAWQKNPEDSGRFVVAFTGKDRYVTDYLVSEVLQRQPAEVRGFLRQTAILDRLCAPLCDAILDVRRWMLDAEKSASSSPPLSNNQQPTSNVQSSQEIIAYLERSNLFLIPLDHSREWYRYHRLFAEVLRARLQPEEKARLHARAARWYEEHGLLSEAVQHALAAAAISGDTREAERLIRLAAEEAMHAGAVLAVRGWVEALPDERVRADGELAAIKAAVLLMTGELAPAEVYADVATALLKPGAPAWGRVLALRSFIALSARRNYEQAIAESAQALQALGESQPHWRVLALWVMAESQERIRPIAEAIATYREAVRTGRALGNQFFAALAEAWLASALNESGRRREAVAICEEAIGHYIDELGRPALVAGTIFTQLALLYYEANELEKARRHRETALQLGEQLALDLYTGFSQALFAPMLPALGETEAALEALHRAHQLASETSYTDTDWCLAWEVNIRLKQGDLPFALRWAETSGLSPEDDVQAIHMDQHLAYARFLLAQGHLDDVRRWLSRLEIFARERGLVRRLITVHILQALADEKEGQVAAARERLARAVELAAPEGYVRSFLDEGAVAIALLPGVRPAAPLFVDQLLREAGIPLPRAQAAQPLVEPLSERELEVLGLIAAGCSNQEIADRLVIAAGTVKRHVNHILGKLGVRSRTQALARARELGLLED